MTQDEIVEMARQSGAVSGKPTLDSPEIVFTQCLDIYHFAKLVAAKEREVVAVFLEKECEEQYLADRVRSREFNGAEKWMK